MKKYGKNWYNGRGDKIYNPRAYFNAVRRNSYNKGWSDGYVKGYSDACNDNSW